jgi:hypothetical protein
VEQLRDKRNFYLAAGDARSWGSVAVSACFSISDLHSVGRVATVQSVACRSRNPKVVNLILTCHISGILILGFAVYSRRLATTSLLTNSMADASGNLRYQELIWLLFDVILGARSCGVTVSSLDPESSDRGPSLTRLCMC